MQNLKVIPHASEEAMSIPVLEIVHHKDSTEDFKVEWVILNDEKYGTIIGKALADRYEELKDATLTIIKASKDQLLVADYNRARMKLKLNHEDAELFAKGQFEGTINQ